MHRSLKVFDMPHEQNDNSLQNQLKLGPYILHAGNWNGRNEIKLEYVKPCAKYNFLKTTQR